jgi:hypothetical protein
LKKKSLVCWPVLLKKKEFIFVAGQFCLKKKSLSLLLASFVEKKDSRLLASFV